MTTALRVTAARARTAAWGWRVAGLLVIAAWVSPTPVLADTFLWKMQGESNTVYLLGSVHFLPRDAYPLPEAVEAAYRRSAKLVFETDLTALKSPEFSRRLLKAGALPAGESIRIHLSPGTYDKLRAASSRSELPIEALDRLKPSVVSMMLLAPRLAKLGVDPEWGVDAYLHRRALDDGKAVAGLETAEFQLSLLTALPGRLQEEMLLQTLDEYDLIAENLSAMIDRWRAGDVTGLSHFLKEGFRDYPALEKTFLTDRNRRWVTKIEALGREPADVLVVVGAGHMVGYDGVIELLRILGHRVEQL